jgi:hypothetical protein
MTGEGTRDQFAGMGFAVGSLIGSRSFSVTPDGWLTGYIRPQKWLPGVNEALCLNQGQACGFTPDAGGEHTHSMACRGPKPCGKDVPNLLCQCGFYAYFDGSLNYGAEPTTLSGIVEGFGHVLRGSRGFRCRKARVLALFIPPPVPEVLDAPVLQLTTAVGAQGYRVRAYLAAAMEDRVRRVQANYPRVAFFSDVHQMLAAYLPSMTPREV